MTESNGKEILKSINKGNLIGFITGIERKEVSKVSGDTAASDDNEAGYVDVVSIGKMPVKVYKRLIMPDPNSESQFVQIQHINKVKVKSELDVKKEILDNTFNQNWEREFQKEKKETSGSDLADYREQNRYYSVRVVNLPQLSNENEFKDFLRDQGCTYINRVNVPRFKDDRTKFRDFAFVKFERLRHAAAFYQAINDSDNPIHFKKNILRAEYSES